MRKVIQVPCRWPGETINGLDLLRVAIVRLAGCTCEHPLLGGHLPGDIEKIMLPMRIRCRLCNAEVDLERQ